MTEASDSGIDKLTPKQQGFVLDYLADGNAAEAYRRNYECANMAAATVQREATRLLANPTVNHIITTRRAQVAKQAGLSRSWVLERLMRNAEVSLGERTIKLRVQRKDRETGKVEVGDIEVSVHDAPAANRALELLGKSDEIQLFKERHEHTGEDGEALFGAAANPRELARVILGILSTAKLADAPARHDPVDDEPEDDGEVSSTSSAAGMGTGDCHPPDSVAIAALPPQKPRPATLERGEREIGDNGAEIAHDAEFGRYAVHGADGRLVGYRADLDAARALAAKQKPSPEAKEHQ